MTVSNTSELYMTENPPQSEKITAGSVKNPKIVMFTTVGKNRQRRLFDGRSGKNRGNGVGKER